MDNTTQENLVQQARAFLTADRLAAVFDPGLTARVTRGTLLLSSRTLTVLYKSVLELPIAQTVGYLHTFASVLITYAEFTATQNTALLAASGFLVLPC